MNQETLEQQSLWYQYKTAVWPRASGQKTEVSGQMAVVHNIMRVLRAIRNQGGLAYVSVPITSGKYLYELKLQDSTARTQSGAGALLERAISHN
ncbi:MAG: hypothetical protein HYY92_00540, partial [Parcubacteria group bacterium]|nr:hypothetical protein [Parcubacteria group bacterium]